ncbi:DsbA family oxidoreductase [Cellulomonas chengniuliangii]|uniref:DsbA family oxidoreductase n=1 Tax=Cellulomonas chengniuliangii TaxID=2968084 RepID=A0ABY5L4X7_9CELL|nr:DsbA family oxidoreductase [Cellulomonas chengniuliangii]MCC2308354.1 DsbA family oxidoreductase [Cellulomonas chengniuliangii]UUI76736.1 DsbA family oxidoreductase [Cellulomonas chengniuliangii]
MSSPVSVHVWSDIACPWCFVGKRRFERAVADFEGEVVVEYHSFELAPDTPVDFEGDEVEFLAGHKGMPVEQVRQMLDQMTGLAAAEGLAFDFGSVRHTKTLLAHQALHHAKEQGKQLDLVERLFSAYFEQGRHVGRAEELAALAAEVGIDPVDLLEALADGRHSTAVEADIAAARQLGIRGVPFYVIDDRYGISGAQSPDVFRSALERAVEDRAAAGGQPEQPESPVAGAR